ncbi:MAG: Cache 3/Cache 2 fusion domain-containing protein [Desulfatiglandales bacterium]
MRTKLVSVTLFLVLFPLLCVAYLSIGSFGKAIRRASEQDLEHLVKNVYSMCRIQQEAIQIKVLSDLNVARDVLHRHGDHIEIVEETPIHFDAIDQFTGEVWPVSVPLWKMGDGTILTMGVSPVDEVEALVGSRCTIFQRIEGDRFLRIATNVPDHKGRRAIGTYIPADSPVVQAILSETPYNGRVDVINGWYIAAYEPIKGIDGSVIGALSVGVKEHSADALKKEIEGIKVGDTGHVSIMDGEGLLIIHPEREGENIIESRDAHGFDYIRAMISNAIHLSVGQVEAIRYRSVDPKPGESPPRQMITQYTYFRPWDWIIAAGTYEEEIYRDLSRTERFIALTVFAGLVLVFFLTFTLSKVLTKPIQELTEVTTKMVGGDLSQRVRVRGGDEIGVLGTSFNRMIGQIQHYTSNLEKIVEARTQELKESREKYRDLSHFLKNILDSATEYAIIALDFHGNIMEFNNGAERLFGWKKEEVVNKERIDVTMTPEDRVKGVPALISKQTRSIGLCELDMTRVGNAGRRFPVHTSVTAIRDRSGRTTGFLEIIRDLTQRKILEKELRETKELLENIMESSVDGIVTTDMKGKITYLNRAMEDMIQYRREEILGRHISTVYVRGIEEAREVMAFLRAGERAENYEMEVKRKDGAVLVILNSLFLVRDEEARVIGTAGIFKDITEQKQLEAKLKAAQARMVEASKMRALGELVAGVAHELNNPLMASQTILHVILKNLKPECEERERLELIKKCNNRIEKIVQHLREFSRQVTPEFQAVDMNQPVENALMITGQQLLNHGISIERNLAEGLPKVIGDSNQLEQVFLNLISNARDAMEDISGPKALTISSFLSEDESGRWVVVSIKDTGVGIPDENFNKILEPFFTTKPVGKGTGLGLSLCYGIIEAHEGRMEINSAPGLGTRIEVFLPIKEKE